MAQLKDLLVNGDAKFLANAMLDHDPTLNLEAATKHYVDQAVSGSPQGTVTSITLTQGTGISVSNSGTAITTSGTRTIALDQAFGAEFIVGTQTAATGSWTGVTQRAALYDGMQIAYWLPYAGSGNATLNLTLAGGGTTGAVNCYYNGTSRLTTHYGAGNLVHLTYRSNVNIGGTDYTGWWSNANYDSNDYDCLREYYAQPRVDANSDFDVYMYQLLLTTKSGTIVPYSNGHNAPTTYTKTMTTDSFDPFAPIYRWSVSWDRTEAKGAIIPAGYLYSASQLVDVRYYWNIVAGGTAGTTSLTANQPVYIKAKYTRTAHTAALVPNSSSSNYLERSSIVQTLPTSNPNSGLPATQTYIYIFLGYAYDSYRMVLYEQKPIYWWDPVSDVMGQFTDQPMTFAGSDGTAAGTPGLVPAPTANDAGKFLCGDGSWSTPANTTYSAGTGLTLSGTQFSVTSANVSTMMNLLSEGSSNATRNDYIIAQYAGGGTSTTTYHRRKLSNIFAALNSSDITTALGYTPYNSTNPNGYTSNTGTVTSVKLIQGTGITVTSSGTAITTSGERTISLNTASTSALGGVKVGEGLAINSGNGILSIDSTGADEGEYLMRGTDGFEWGIPSNTTYTFASGKGTTNGFTVTPTGGSATTYSVGALLANEDKRSSNTAPSTYYVANGGLRFLGLKNNSTLGLSSVDGAGTYSTGLGLAPWSDSSGGPAWELAFNSAGIFARQGTATWGSWEQLAYKSTLASYVPLAGGTMTGVLTMKGNQYEDSYSGALNMNNSNIYNSNGIYFADAAEYGSEGLNFWRSATTVDSLWANGGNLYFTPGRTLGQQGTSYTVVHSGNFQNYDYEAYLKWGGQNFVGSYGVADACMISVLGANRLECLRTSDDSVGIEIAYSRDGGTTWTDYGLTNAQKRSLFTSSTGSSVIIGKRATADTKSVNDRARVIIHTGAAGVYTILNKFAIYLSTNGSGACWVTIDKCIQQNDPATEANWVNVVTKQAVSGWSGWNIINVSGITTYGNRTDTQFGHLRFIFGADTAGSTSYAGLNITKIMGFGGVGWATPSNLAAYGHLYTWDYDSAAYFPAHIYTNSNKSYDLGGSSKRWRYVFAGYFNSDNSAENVNSSTYTSTAVVPFFSSDGYLRKTSKANFLTWLGTGSVTSITLTQGTGITVSDSGTAITTSGTRTISLNTASTSALGGIKVGEGLSINSGNGILSIDSTGADEGEFLMRGTDGFEWGVPNISTLTATSASAVTTNPGTGKLGYYYCISKDTPGLFSATDAANAILTIHRYSNTSSNYCSQLGFSNGAMYFRTYGNSALDTTKAWNKVITDGTIANTLKMTSGSLDVNYSDGLANTGTDGALVVDFAGSGSATTAARSDHGHGYISNTGALGSTASATPATGDALVIMDSSDSSKISYNKNLLNATHGGTFLRRDGTWQVPPATSGITGVWVNASTTYTNTAVCFSDGLTVTYNSTANRVVVTCSNPCLIEGTKIRMADGTEKPIEQIQTGDEVASYDLNTGKLNTAIVVQNILTGRALDYTTYFFDDGRYIIAYGRHPVFNKTLGRSADIASEFTVGDETYNVDGQAVIYVGSMPYNARQRRLPAHYDLTTSNGLYFANGILNSKHILTQYHVMDRYAMDMPEEIAAIAQRKEDLLKATMCKKDEGYLQAVAAKFKEEAQLKRRIADMKQKLADSDYIVQKFTEGLVGATEWLKSKAERASWRSSINEAEPLLTKVSNEIASLRRSFSSGYASDREAWPSITAQAAAWDNEAIDVYREWLQNNK